jgi:hypothetical protein
MLQFLAKHFYDISFSLKFSGFSGSYSTRQQPYRFFIRIVELHTGILLCVVCNVRCYLVCKTVL